MSMAVEVDGLERSFARGKVKALAGLTLAVQEGETVGIVGPNGAGKSTLFACLLGFIRPSAGSVRVLGLAPDDLGARALTGWLPERLADEGGAMGRDVLRLHHGLARRPRALREQELAALCERVGLAQAVVTRRAGSYSRGQRQRLALALALVGRPRLLLLDEPTTGLDPLGVASLREILASLRADGVTVLFNSHDLTEVERIADRVAFVHAGRVRSTEAVATARAAARVLRVVVEAGELSAQDRQVLQREAAAAGGRLLEVRAGAARVALPGDVEAALLVRGLVLAGLRVVEVAPEQGRLERLYLAHEHGAGVAGRSAASVAARSDASVAARSDASVAARSDASVAARSDASVADGGAA